MILRAISLYRATTLLLAASSLLCLSVLDVFGQSAMSGSPRVAAVDTASDIMVNPVMGNMRILFVRPKFTDLAGLVSDFQAQQHANTIKSTLETNSYGKLQIQFDVTPELLMPNPSSFYRNGPSLVRLRADALEAASDAGFDVSTYDRQVILSQQVWVGAVGNFVGTYTAFESLNIPYISAHEIGHTFDWNHSNFWCVLDPDPIATNATEREYWDAYDIMGDGLPGLARTFHHFNPWFKSRAGWIPESNVLTVTTSGTYTIQALEMDPDSNVPVQSFSALRVPRTKSKDYWVFYRSQESRVNNGAVITQGYHSNLKPSLLLDMTPLSQNDDWKDVALAPGNKFTDAAAGVSIKTISRNSTTLQVKVTVPSTPPGRLPIIDIISPSKDKVLTGLVDYEIQAADPDIGPLNGDGISEIDLFLHPFIDGLIGSVRRGLNPPSPAVSAVLTAPPYRLRVDTRTVPDAGYFMVVRAISTQGDSNMVWLAQVIDNTGPTLLPPRKVAQFSPANRSVAQPVNLTLVWRSTRRASSYHLQVSQDQTFATTILDQTGIVDTTFSLSNLDFSATYYWRVAATNAAGSGLGSGVWQFTTMGAPPVIPSLLSPPNGATGVNLRPVLSWNAASGATSYRVQLAADAVFTSVVFDSAGLTATSAQTDSLAGSTTYFWRVNASNNDGTSDWSPTWSLTTVSGPPLAPTLSTPVDSATGVSTSPVLTWQTVPGAASYAVQVSTLADFTTLTADTSGVTVPSYQAPGLAQGVQYFWRVNASNAGGVSPWSAVWSFLTIAAPPQAPALATPVDNALDVDVEPTFVWNSSPGADSYRLEVSQSVDFVSVTADQTDIPSPSFKVSGLAEKTHYFWRVNARNAGGVSDWSAVWSFTTKTVTSVGEDASLPKEFRLRQNYPNPFNPSTRIAFALPRSVNVNLKVYDLLGNEVATLLNERMSPGEHTVTFDAGNLPSGIYFYKLQAGRFSQTKKLMLLQ